MNRHLQYWTLLLFSVCLMAAAWGQAPAVATGQSLQVIELKHRTAEEVIPALKPLLEPGAALSGDNFTLFVRTSPANFVQLRQALDQIDRQPAQFLISVRNSTRQEIEREQLAASAAVGNNGARVRVQATDDNARQQGTNLASVLVLEGNEAFIATGQGPSGAGGGLGQRSRGVENSGFTVTPRRRGEDFVILDIEQRSSQRGVSGRIENQSLSTQVSGRIGQWIELAAVNGSSSTTQSGILSRGYATSSDARSMWVKVELSP
jgi:hypothetical protein